MERFERDSPAFLYAMRRAVDGAVKIGVSHNPQLRVLHLIDSFKIHGVTPEDIELLDWVFLKDPFAMEHAVHNHYRDAKASYLGPRTTNEWFSISDDTVETIFRIFRDWPEALAS